MTLFHPHSFESLDDLLLDQLRDLYDAERRQTGTLERMARVAESPQLQAAFRQHLSETQQQVTRLEQAFRQLGADSARESCQAMQCLVEETEHIVEAKGVPYVRDAALIAAAQRMEHYELAGYGTARAFAEELGYQEIVTLLQRSLEEEAQADGQLTDIAEQRVNIRAAHGSE
jgi:ferritin-like metal-binding protein YciE